MSNFTEAKLESAIIDLLKNEGYDYVPGEFIVRKANTVLIKDYLSTY